MSHPTIEFLGPTPRRVPLPVRCHLLFGGSLNQIAWFMVFFTMFFFWGFFMNSEAITWITFPGSPATISGAVTRCESTNASEGGGKNRPGTRIYANHYLFSLDGKQYTGCSYSPGQQLMPGQMVNIEYSPSNPAVARIQGMRVHMFGAGAVLVLLFPFIGLCLMLPGYFLGKKARRLLECGQLTEGILRTKEPTNTTINNQRVFKFTFDFKAGDGRVYQVVSRTHQTAKLEDEASEQIIYDPADPANALLVDALPGQFRVDEAGNFQPASSRAALAVTFLPLLTIGGNLAWAVLRLL